MDEETLERRTQTIKGHLRQGFPDPRIRVWTNDLTDDRFFRVESAGRAYVLRVSYEELTEGDAARDMRDFRVVAALKEIAVNECLVLTTSGTFRQPLSIQ